MNTKYVGVILIMAALIAMMLLALLMGGKSHATAATIVIKLHPTDWHYYMGRGELDGRCGVWSREVCIWDRAKI